MRAAASEFHARLLEHPHLLETTFATGRPGCAPEDLLTDVEYAELVVHALPETPLSPTSPASLDGPLSSTRYTVGRLKVGGGNAVMNNQILRSAAFAGPSLEISLPVIADRSSYSLSLRGISPRADHLDLLLFAISLVHKAPHPELGVDVSFTTHQFLSALGWAINSDGYARVVKIAEELKRIELRYHDRSDASGGKIHLNNLFAALTMPDRESGEQRWTVVLPAALFRIFDLRRNAIVDLSARAAIRSDFGRWLHAFFSSQEPGYERRYDAVALCAAGGIHCGRPSDTMKHLRATLSILSRGEVAVRKTIKRFEPILAAGWKLSKNDSGNYELAATRFDKPRALAAVSARLI
jgi:hypothetical protein